MQQEVTERALIQQRDRLTHYLRQCGDSIDDATEQWMREKSVGFIYTDRKINQSFRVTMTPACAVAKTA